MTSLLSLRQKVASLPPLQPDLHAGQLWVVCPVEQGDWVPAQGQLNITLAVRKVTQVSCIVSEWCTNY